ncbi:MAG TPA: endolytic transglycosylase MltG, partial [Leptospiraceae bacterium]|nr:endolytic transglycosylase MltG [Leptospiraceae bacterium]
MDKKKIIRIIIGAAAALLIGAGLFAIAGPGRPPGNGSKKVLFEIESGSGPGSVSERLAAEGLITNSAYLRFLLRTTAGGKIKMGVYEINDGMSAGEIASLISRGKVKMISITIPEGWHNRQIADEMVAKGLVKTTEEFLKLTEDPQVLAKYKIPAKTTEGYLFPETYSVPLGYSATSFQDLMIRQFLKKAREAGAAENITPQELHEKVIMASIIEREALKREELPLMAQVFENRLEKRMKLESCATIQYLFERPHKKLYERDLVIQSPY